MFYTYSELHLPLQLSSCAEHPCPPPPGLLLVTTPFTLARLLSCCCFLFGRLYHLVLDEADRLFALAPEQVTSSSSSSFLGVHLKTLGTLLSS